MRPHARNGYTDAASSTAAVCEDAMVEERFGERYAAAIAAIDASNAHDPVTITIDGEQVPKEPAHARLMTAWVERLAPDASEALMLAARAHHIRRWEIRRSEYPGGRQGYLKWRQDMRGFHAEKAAEILRACGYEDGIIARVGEILRKEGLGNDREVQVFEDALNLVFLETQFHEFRGQHEPEKLARIVRRTWRKMSAAGRERVRGLDMPEEDRAFLEEVLRGQV